jgi:hypothetical protein
MKNSTKRIGQFNFKERRFEIAVSAPAHAITQGCSGDYIIRKRCERLRSIIASRG